MSKKQNARNWNISALALQCWFVNRWTFSGGLSEGRSEKSILRGSVLGLLQDHGFDVVYKLASERDETGDTFEGNAQFEEFRDDFGEVFEEFVIVVGICFNPFLHYFVLIISSSSGSESVPERENNRLATS
jgi:hypothetical protein